MALQIDACIALHQGDRKEQQDRVLLVPHPHGKGAMLAVLADGMGGHTGGALAAQQVIHTAKTNFSQFSIHDESPRFLLETCVQEAHLLIRASRYLNEKDPHSTAVMFLLQSRKASWIHCGDSRLYRFRNGRPYFKTHDHSFVQQLVSEGKITPAQALTHPNRNILVTSLGGEDLPVVDFGETGDIQNGDAFLLCSDGLWEYFSDEELAGVIGSCTAREASNLLINWARNKAMGYGDNISLAIIRLTEGPGGETSL